MITIKEALLAAQAMLSDTHEASEAKLEAQLLLQHVLNVNRAWLITHESDALQTNTHAAFESLLNRRLTGEPIAHILGYREFFGFKLKVTPDTLIPRPDTETLVETALSKIPKNTTPAPFQRTSGSSDFQQYQDKMFDSEPRRDDSFDILDLGTGSGAIAIAIAKHAPYVEVTAADASTAALAIAKENAAALQISNVQFLSSNWFSSLKGTRFDIIVSNPPYIEQDDTHLSQGDLRFEPMSALASGADGLDDIRHIITTCIIHLKPQSWLMLEHGYNQAERVADLMANAGLVDIETIHDLGGNDRVTIGKNPLIVSTHWD
ncbi:MAG: peptide chain release factor N(5)-glutamine methyltransferase [Betaproteobacteria bacterium HGW-Betaproteobacteria-22]|nr:MAG: peptide chain release factor N(5)-glutamine methyltransferase [Betaproteobacteria bacterium HGW-Betaproteobacteria-22]